MLTDATDTADMAAYNRYTAFVGLDGGEVAEPVPSPLAALDDPPQSLADFESAFQQPITRPEVSGQSSPRARTHARAITHPHTYVRIHTCIPILTELPPSQHPSYFGLRGWLGHTYPEAKGYR